jgi:hypothetical protein
VDDGSDTALSSDLIMRDRWTIMITCTMATTMWQPRAPYAWPILIETLDARCAVRIRPAVLAFDLFKPEPYASFRRLRLCFASMSAPVPCCGLIFNHHGKESSAVVRCYNILGWLGHWTTTLETTNDRELIKLEGGVCGRAEIEAMVTYTRYTVHECVED